MIINGYTIAIVLAIVALYYYLGYQHGKSDAIKKAGNMIEDLYTGVETKYDEWKEAHR